MVDEGVVGWMRLDSEEGWGVAGPSFSDSGAVFDGPSTDMDSWTLTSDGSAFAENSTRTVEACRVRAFRRRRGALAGKGASGTDSQGSLREIVVSFRHLDILHSVMGMVHTGGWNSCLDSGVAVFVLSGAFTG